MARRTQPTAGARPRGWHAPVGRRGVAGQRPRAVSVQCALCARSATDPQRPEEPAGAVLPVLRSRDVHQEQQQGAVSIRSLRPGGTGRAQSRHRFVTPL